MLNIAIAIKGAGEMASAIAWRLHQCRIRSIFMMEIEAPLAVRRYVSFCNAVYTGMQVVEEVRAQLAAEPDEVAAIWRRGAIAVGVDPHWEWINFLQPDVVVDATLAKVNLGTSLRDAPLVIGVGPGFDAPSDVHMVVETHRGHHLGRIITSGSAAANTGIPGEIGGFTHQRVLRSPVKGQFNTDHRIGDKVRKGETVGEVDQKIVTAGIEGVLRGLIRTGSVVKKGMKIGDIDPRGDKTFCVTISDKARAISGSVLECILRVYNRADQPLKPKKVVKE